jgi:hypothetical protein
MRRNINPRVLDYPVAPTIWKSVYQRMEPGKIRGLGPLHNASPRNEEPTLHRLGDG